jgi:predicted small secreted protein
MKTIPTLLAVSFVLLLTACNTMRGAGEDIQKAGSAIEKAATKK